MKTKLFLAAAAAIALVGCNKEVGNVQPSAAEGPASFLQVDLRAAGTITKADPGTFVYGSDAENLVKTVHFWFFDANGGEYAVQNTDNYMAVNPSWTPGTPNQNVEEISDVVLVIKRSQQAPPAKMVAVLNAPADLQKSMSLAELEAAVVKSLTTDDAFIMSNSVYADGTVKVTATDILEENIFTTDVTDYKAGDVIPSTETELLANITPIQVYVERVAAKVQVSGKDASGDVEAVDLNKIPVYAVAEDGTATTEQMTDSEGNALYVKVLGWQVTNNNDQANLIKVIDPSWSDLGFTPWNNAALYRSYWAKTSDVPEHNFTFNGIKGHLGADYYFENTGAAADENKVDVTEDGDFDIIVAGNQAPQLLVAAQLVNNEGTPVSLAKWYGVFYTVEDLKVAMVNTVASKLYVKAENGTLSSIGVDDVTFYQVPATTADNRYEVKVTVKEGVTYYKADGTTVADNAAALLDAIDPAQMWGGASEDAVGYTYYYLTISHFGTAKGIVRNHCYDIAISSVNGLGTPVYDPSQIITPEKPEDQEALNLAAQINILSWHLVSQEVTLQ